MGRAVNRRSSIVEQVGTLASPAAATAAIRDVYYSQDWQALEERVRTPAGAIPTTADTRFVWSPVYVDAMIARDRNADGNTTTGTGGLEQRVYALQDANWNTTAIIAAAGVPGVAAGNVINRFAYTPYGESQTLTASWTTPPAGSTPAVPWAHLFQGLKFTDVTGLAYVRHRDYSATLGRFIELDPIGFDAGDNNWYRFVANGPTGRVDPSGLITIPQLLWRAFGPFFAWAADKVFNEAIDIAQITAEEKMRSCVDIACKPACDSCCDQAYTQAKTGLAGATIQGVASCVTLALSIPIPGLWPTFTVSLLCNTYVLLKSALVLGNINADYQGCKDSCLAAEQSSNLG